MRFPWAVDAEWGPGHCDLNEQHQVSLVFDKDRVSVTACSPAQQPPRS